MKIFMGRARFEELCAGLSPVERDKLTDQVELYPDDVWVDWEVDQDRVGVRLLQLLHEQQLTDQVEVPGPPPAQVPDVWLGLGPEWEEVGHGVWFGPQAAQSPWLDQGVLLAELNQPDTTGGARRYFLNDVVRGERDGARVVRKGRGVEPSGDADPSPGDK